MTENYNNTIQPNDTLTVEMCANVSKTNFRSCPFYNTFKDCLFVNPIGSCNIGGLSKTNPNIFVKYKGEDSVWIKALWDRDYKYFYVQKLVFRDLGEWAIFMFYPNGKESSIIKRDDTGKLLLKQTFFEDGSGNTFEKHD